MFHFLRSHFFGKCTLRVFAFGLFGLCYVGSDTVFDQSVGSVVLAQEISAAVQSTEIKDEQIERIGGNWGVLKADLVDGEGGSSSKGARNYYYNDAGRWVDLFSYHLLDSNKDGIPNLRLSHDSTHLIIRSQGYPNHPTAIFPNSGNPNTIRVQDFTFRLPLVPKKSGVITRLPMGPVGMALNGVVFFNPFEMAGLNAVEGYDEVWLDACCGHPQQTGVYHYHKYPTCVKSPFKDTGAGHSPIIGFAFDGFPVYGPYESEGTRAMELTNERALDACNGHEDEQRGYHYHVTPNRFPYILGGYAGVVEPSNNREFRRARTGALEDQTQPGDKFGSQIISVVPGNLQQGKLQEVRITIDPSKSRRPIPQEAPSWVQVGPYEALKIVREGDTIIATIQVPADAALGVWLDCHLEFGGSDGIGRPPVVLKKNNSARVIMD